MSPVVGRAPHTYSSDDPILVYGRDHVPGDTTVIAMTEGGLAGAIGNMKQ